jgi:DNA replication and repair protein RecF
LHVKNISLSGFRNLGEQSVNLCEGLNLLIGENGQGKTNFLEAVYLVATLRSFRSTSVRDVISFGREEAEVSAEVDKHGVPIGLRVCLSGSARRLWLGARPVQSVGDFLGQLKVVAFTPDDLGMIKGGPALRRRFLDRTAFLFDLQHMVHVKRFNQALKSRNRLLREKSQRYLDVVDSFSQAMAAEGVRVSQNRRRFLEPVGRKAGEILAELVPECDAVKMTFKPGWDMGKSTSHEDLLEQIRSNINSDVRRGHTGLGPQQDDFEIETGEGSARKFASQGQQRAVAVALLLAVVQEIVESGGERPVILLDDVSSELDPTRRKILFERVDELGGQTLITTTDEGMGAEMNVREMRKYRVIGGEIKTYGEN